MAPRPYASTLLELALLLPLLLNAVGFVLCLSDPAGQTTFVVCAQPARVDERRGSPKGCR